MTDIEAEEEHLADRVNSWKFSVLSVSLWFIFSSFPGFGLSYFQAFGPIHGRSALFRLALLGGYTGY